MPIGQGCFAAADTKQDQSNKITSPLLPLFTALPYLQPGPLSSLTDGQEQMVIAWQTEARPGAFAVTYGTDRPEGQTAQITHVPRWSGDPDDGEDRFNYAATLTGLKLNTKYKYRVLGGRQTLMEGFFTTRKGRGTAVRFATFGDNSYGDISDRAVAHQAWLSRPDFVMNTGDNVYDGGLDNEYNRFFFPVYNSDTPGPRLGAPLLRSVPFYTIIANHDVHDKDPDKHPVADFTKDPDSLAYFTAMHLPANGFAPSHPTPTNGDAARLAGFQAAAGRRFPTQANYSFDYGDCHFLCLDANIYVDPTDAALQKWITDDLKTTDALWKFVVYHHPAFNVGAEHYAEQHMRVLTPIFEAHGVDFCLHGHEHNYQRTRPFSFVPDGPGAAAKINSKARLVPGKFTVDTAFDGAKHTTPQGIIYLTTGAGGKHLYDVDYTGRPEMWTHEEDGHAAYVALMVSDRHSLTVFDVDGPALLFRQIDESGHEIDRVRVTKNRKGKTA